MDMLGDSPKINFSDGSWHVLSRQNTIGPPQYIGRNAVIENSVITEGCEIYGTVKNSVLGSGVKVMSGASVYDAVIMDSVTVGEGASVSYSIVDTSASVGAGAKVGMRREPGAEIAVIPAGITVPSGCEVTPFEKIAVI